MGLSTVAVALSPLAVLLVGANENQEDSSVTWDCWKPVLRDESVEPSNGILLKDIIQDSRIKDVIIADDQNDSKFPLLYLRNIWDEEFRIDYVYLPKSNKLALHAFRLQ